jgi:lipopolysaccharide export system protein LptA
MKKTPEIDHWELTERVYIRELNTKDEIRGGYAFYDRKTDIMRVIDKPILYISKEKATIFSDLLKSHRKEKMTIFIGDVEIIQESKKIYGEKAIFNEEKKRILISGNPFLIERQNITHSEQITVLTDKKEVRLSQRFRGVLIPEDDTSGRTRTETGTEQPARNGDRDPRRSIPIGDIGGSEIL